MSGTRTRRKWATLVSGVALVPLLVTACSSGSTSGGTPSSGSSGSNGSKQASINVAVVSNPDMQRMEKLLPDFQKTHPGIKVKFTTLDEITLRDKLSQDIATQSGQFDVAMVGVVETPQWARNDWLASLQDYASAPDYDVNDLIKPVRDALSVDGKLYAVPFSGESSQMMYRKDLFQKAGLSMPAQPTWDQIEQFAAKLNNPSKSLAGICLRGQAGWGSNVPTVMNMVHAYGGHIYDAIYKAALDTPEAKRGIEQYLRMITKYGEKGAANSSFQECQNLFNQGKAAMWYDATSVASATVDPKQSKVADQIGFAQAPSGTVKSGGWLWAWSLVMVKTSKNHDAAWQFMDWATSKDYLKLAGQTYGWNFVPPGTRTSTYQIPEYQKGASKYADLTLKAIGSAGVHFNGGPDTERSFYVDIPEWPDTGDKIGKIISAGIVGDKSPEQVIAEANQELNNTATKGKYTK